MGVVEIAAIVTAAATVIGVVAAIFFRQATHRASVGGVVAPDNKGTIATRRDTATTDHATTVERAGSVHVEHHGLPGEDHDRLVRMEATLENIVRVTTPPGTPPPNTGELVAQATESIEKLEDAAKLFNAGEYREAIEHVLTAYDRELPPRAKAQLHLVAGNAYFFLSDYGAAEGHYKEVMQAALDSNDRKHEAAAIGGVGLVREGRGDLEGAEEHYRKALAIDEEIGDRSGQASALGNLGNVYRVRGDLEGAERYHREALAIQEEIGDRSGQGHQLGNLGNVCFERGDWERAENYHRKALDISEEIGSRSLLASELGNLGVVYSVRGDLEAAERYHREALAIQEEIGDRSGQGHQWGNLGNVHRARGDLEGADEHYRRALGIFEEIGAAREVEATLKNLAKLNAMKDD